MDGQILMEDDMTSQELIVSASIARDRKPLPAKSRLDIMAWAPLAR